MSFEKKVVNFEIKPNMDWIMTGGDDIIYLITFRNLEIHLVIGLCCFEVCFGTGLLTGLQCYPSPKLVITCRMGRKSASEKQTIWKDADKQHITRIFHVRVFGDWNPDIVQRWDTASSMRLTHGEHPTKYLHGLKHPTRSTVSITNLPSGRNQGHVSLMARTLSIREYI